jgi:predicted nucleic acid-binding protein
LALAVVDASAAASLVFGEEGAEAVAARLEGQDLIAPSLLPYEMVNVAAVKLRRRSLSARQAQAGLDLFAKLDLAMHDADPVVLAALAGRTGLTAYDAAYLWLARTMGAELVTLDRKLEAAWRGER